MNRQESLDYYLAMIDLASEQRQPTHDVLSSMATQWANHWHLTAEEILSGTATHQIQPKESA